MRHANPDPDDDAFTDLDQALTRAEEITTNDPLASSPRRTLLLSTMFALAVVLLAAVISYTAAVIAVYRAERHTDERVAVLERDLQQRRAAAAEQNANRDAQIAELRRLVCLFADHAQPRDAAVEDVRARYGCTGVASPTPSPSRTVTVEPTARATAQGAHRTGGGPGGPGVGGATRQPTAGPSPTTTKSPTLAVPSQQVPPPPATGDELLCIDLPLLPVICL
jgi:hypothetical protein